MANTQNKKKRYYKEGQIVWSIELKKPVKVKSVNKDALTITVTEEKNGEIFEHTFPLWRVDVLKYKAKEKLKKENKKREKQLLFAKVKENARIPKKAADTEAGYDVWACLEPTKDENGKDVYELFLPRFKPTLVPTGIATCVGKTFYLNFANERGSTGKLGMLVLSGIVDSSYRGEVFVNITPIYKDVLITSEVDEVEENDDLILYPYSKAICQLIDYRTANLEPVEITYEELKAIPSNRGTGALGSSGH